jgi:hypothetical protein
VILLREPTLQAGDAARMVLQGMEGSLEANHPARLASLLLLKLSTTAPELPWAPSIG